MPLEQQVCSLEQAKKLKELGVKQESDFWWVKCKDNTFAIGYTGNFIDDEKYSAFTVSELSRPRTCKSTNISQANTFGPFTGTT